MVFCCTLCNFLCGGYCYQLLRFVRNYGISFEESCRIMGTVLEHCCQKESFSISKANVHLKMSAL